MTNLQEVPTDELLSFQDYSPEHSGNNKYIGQAEINISSNPDTFQDVGSRTLLQEADKESTSKSFWTLEYYQQFFNVDTTDVFGRILSSITPKRGNKLQYQLREKPDLYGPFWISMTLIFTIAVSGNVANYLQHANTNYHWKYDFRLISYAATAIWLYVTLIPFGLWAVLKWTTEISDLNDPIEKIPNALELICIYGYSLFIYIPVSILWCIQISSLQWSLVLIAALLSGSVLLLTLMPALLRSRQKLFLVISIITCHLLLAAGFMLYFFRHSDGAVIAKVQNVVSSTNSTVIADVINKNNTH